jgi:hypothetical protein
MRHAALAVFVVSLGLAPISALPDSRLNTPPASAPALTGKERLSDKASDEQRINDCRVPPERRTRARPTQCHPEPP